MQENVIYVGKKPFMNYIMAATTIAREHDELEIKARGGNIKKAVDLAESLVNRFLVGWKKELVEIGTEETELATSTAAPPKKIRVSTIRIKLARLKG